MKETTGFLAKAIALTVRVRVLTTSSVRILAALSLGATAIAGPFTSYNGGAGPDTPIPVASITTWATTVSLYAPSPGLGPNFRNPAAASGIFSLGELYDPASPPAIGTEPTAFHAGSGATNFFPFAGNLADPLDTYGFFGIDAPGSVTFLYPDGIYDGPGPDLAIRENGFASGPSPGFLSELAYVEVSSNGSDFVRFPSISLNTGRVSTAGTFQLYDMTNVYNLAGKHGSTFATPFDLAELASHPLVMSGAVDLFDITHVRLVDVVGNGRVGLRDHRLHPSCRSLLPSRLLVHGYRAGALLGRRWRADGRGLDVRDRSLHRASVLHAG